MALGALLPAMWLAHVIQTHTIIRSLSAGILLLMACTFSCHAQGPETRLALVIDQSDYSGNLSRIDLAMWEADLMQNALRTTGFDVTRASNLTRRELQNTLDDFRKRIERSGRNTVAFVYYTGHGVQHPSTRDSYVLGIDARLNTASDLAVYGLSIGTQRDGFSSTGAKAVFLVFDACRNLPSIPGFKARMKGLARVDASTDMLIAFSTSLNDVAAEGAYAPVLAKEITRSGQSAESAFAATQRKVASATQRRQLPWTNNLLYNEICFAGCNAKVVAQSAIQTVPVTRPNTTSSTDPVASESRSCEYCDELIKINSGSFVMGSPSHERGRDSDEAPRRTIAIEDNFLIGKREVTVGEFRRFVRETRYTISDGCWAEQRGNGRWRFEEDLNWQSPGFSQSDNHPVVCVSWNDAKAFIQWRNEQSSATGIFYSLPSEAQWEYAARSGSEAPAYWSESNGVSCAFSNGADASLSRKLSSLTVSDCDDQFPYTSPAAWYKANEFGLFDMLGNVWEWVEDCYSPSFANGQPDNGKPYTDGVCESAVKRGGSWYNPASFQRSASRSEGKKTERSNNVGFRIAARFE